MAADPSPSEKPPASSSSSSSSSSKIGACFFHLLDWNRKLHAKRHKLLPADRPSNTQSPKKPHKDEKLPMAKLLLIADENRGGFPKSGELFNKERTPEKSKKQQQQHQKKKSGKRSPSVVAKLMGLETMPSPEPPRKEKKTTEDENTNPNDHPFKTVPYNSDNGRLNMNQSGAITCHKSSEEPNKLMFFYKIPALSPRKMDGSFRSILSPSKAHNKLISPIKSPLGTKRLFEAAAKMLEPNMQPSTRMRRNTNIGSRVVRSMLSNVNQEEEKSSAIVKTVRNPPKKPSLNSARQQQQAITSRLYLDQSKAQIQARSKPDKSKVANVSNPNSSSSRLQAAGGSNVRRGAATISSSSSQEVIVSRSKSDNFKDETTPFSSSSSSSASSQHIFRSRSAKDDANHAKISRNDAKPSKDDKAKLDTRKQSRLNQSTSGVKKRGLVSSKQEVVEPIISVRNKGGSEDKDINSAISSNDTNESLKRLSTDSVVTTTKVNSGTSSNGGILHYSRIFGSRKTSSGTTECSKKKGDSSLMKSLLRKRAGPSSDRVSKGEMGKVSLKSSKVIIDKNEDDVAPSYEEDSSFASGECITTDKSSDEMEGSSTETSSTVYSSLEPVSVNVDVTANYSKSMGSSLNYEASESNSVADGDSNVASMKHQFHSIVSENSVNSSCLSSVGECADTASSTAEPEKKKDVSYSGKTTAAILQELLTALNSSKAQIALERKAPNGSSNNDNMSSSYDTMFSHHESAGSYTAIQDIDDSACSDEIQRPRKRLSAITDDWRHPSPVSTLEHPFEDDSFSDSCDSTQERNSHRTLIGYQSDVVSRRHNNLDISSMGLDLKKPCREAFECEEQYMKEIMEATKLSHVDIYAAMLQPPTSLIDPTVFKNLEEQFYQQWEWGVKPEDSLDSDSTLLSDYEQCAVNHRKLIFDCVNEAFRLDLGVDEKQSCQCFPRIPDLSLPYRSRNVCKQINAWKDMACNMNVDDIVEKEMNTGNGKWVDFGYEVSDLAVETETSIVDRLINELVVDLSRGSSISRGSWQCIRDNKRML